MIDKDTILAAIYAVINMIISIAYGFMLGKIGVLTPVTRRVLSNVNYYALSPTYCVYFIMKAIDRHHLTDLGLIFWSCLPCFIVTFIIMIIISIIFRFDSRMRFSYSFVNVYGNVVIMPQMLADSMCGPGAKYSATDSCKSKMVKPYSSIPLIAINILYWVTVLPLLQNEKRIALVSKKIIAIALNFYDSIDDFVKDSEICANAKFLGVLPTKGSNNPIDGNGNVSSPRKLVATDAALGGPSEAEILKQTHSEMPKLISVNDEKFVDEYYQRRLDGSRFNTLTKAFASFEEKFYNKPENEVIRKQIEKEILEPEGLITLPKEENIATVKFYVDHILCAPPAICSLIGLILGFIFPLKEWIFEPTRVPLPTFLGTFETVGGMMSPVSMFLLGTYLAQTVVITKAMFLQWKHIIITNIVKNLVVPALGLFWMMVVFQNTAGSSFRGNPILMFMCFTYWIVPNGIILISVYVVVDYFAKEFAVISVFMNLIAIPMMIVFLILYFLLYDT